MSRRAAGIPGLRALRRIQFFIVDYPALYARPQQGTPAQWRKQTYLAIEEGGNDFLVVVVAGVGFFTDSYLLFASNVVLPMLCYVYWTTDIHPDHETAINSATLAGCIVGQVVFGMLADAFGRRKMYGIELIILAGGTLGFVMSSTGYNGSMNVVSWLIFWRFISGIGVGADYPLSAVITSEFAPTKKRPRMLATVFFMQALGQLSATLVSIVVVAGFRNDRLQGDALKVNVDHIWRWVMGAGLIPAVFAIIFRFTIPESPRYTLDVDGDIFKALLNATRYRGWNTDEHELRPIANNDEHAHRADLETPQINGRHAGAGVGPSASMNGHLGVNGRTVDDEYPKASFRDAYDYFWVKGNWIHLFGTALSWFVLDFAFYGLGMNNPQTIAKIWNIAPKNATTPTRWNTEYNAHLSIFQDLIRSGAHALVVVSIGAVVGGLLLIMRINHHNRKRLQWGGFLALFVVFIILGTSFTKIVQTQFRGVAITLYVISQILFNFGPNSLTFIIPAELFPTRYRTSCHGISAAAGKLGSVTVQLFLPYVKIDHQGIGDPHSRWLGKILLIFSAFMVIGAITTILCIPELQEHNHDSLTLEKLQVGRRGKRVPFLHDDMDEEYSGRAWLARVWRAVSWSR